MLELRFERVCKRFGNGGYGLRDVSFEVPGGRLTSLIGPSGSGKSTLLRIAAGLDTATSGSVHVGAHLSTAMPARDSVTMVFQNNALFPHMNVLGNVAFGLISSGVGRTSAHARATAALELMGLRGFEARACHELSGGEQQRVALARALVLEPSVVLLDEPLSNLDVRLRRQLRDEIRALQRRLALTVAYVTHDEAEAMAIADWLVVMHEGRLRQQGTPRDVYEQPACEFVAGLMGDAAIFHLEVGADGSLALAGLPLPQAHHGQAPGTTVAVMVRPEAWQMHAVGEADGLSGRIRRCAYLGHGIECVVDTLLGDLHVVERRHARRYEPGAPVVLSLKERGVSVIAPAAHPRAVSPPAPGPA